MRPTTFVSMSLGACLAVLSMDVLTSCQNPDKTDPCSKMVKGYVVGFNQCAIGIGFIVATTNPPDTMEVFNLPDSLYHFPTDAQSAIYSNYINDFLFPPSYKNTFPISYTYEIVKETEKHHVICLDQLISHYTIAVKKEIRIICATK